MWGRNLGVIAESVTIFFGILLISAKTIRNLNEPDAVRTNTSIRFT